MRQDFIIKRPPLLNQIINQNRKSIRVAAREKSTWTTAIAQSAAKQLVPFNKPIWVAITIDYQTTITDPDGLYGSLKPVFDGLVKAGIIKGDTVKHIKSPQHFEYGLDHTPMVHLIMFDDPLEYAQYIKARIFLVAAQKQ